MPPVHFTSRTQYANATTPLPSSSPTPSAAARPAAAPSVSTPATLAAPQSTPAYIFSSHAHAHRSLPQAVRATSTPARHFTQTTSRDALGTFTVSSTVPNQADAQRTHEPAPTARSPRSMRPGADLPSLTQRAPSYASRHPVQQRPQNYATQVHVTAPTAQPIRHRSAYSQRTPQAPTYPYTPQRPAYTFVPPQPTAPPPSAPSDAEQLAPLFEALANPNDGAEPVWGFAAQNDPGPSPYRMPPYNAGPRNAQNRHNPLATIGSDIKDAVSAVLRGAHWLISSLLSGVGLATMAVVALVMGTLRGIGTGVFAIAVLATVAVASVWTA